MNWVIEYSDGKKITELDVNFKFAPKENIKLFYFLRNNVRIGIDIQEGLFFIGNKKYDFKIGNGPYYPLQFKKSYIFLSSNNQPILNYNIGCYKFENDYKLKYYFSINKDSILINAQKESSNGEIIEHKYFKVQ